MALFRKNKIVQTKKTAPEQIVWSKVGKGRKQREKAARREEKLRRKRESVVRPPESFKDKLRIWFHRHGHQVAGAFFLAILAVLGFIGYRQAHPKPVTLEESMGIDKLKLSYEVTVDGFDGEMFSYTLYFSDDPDEVQISKRVIAIMDRIAEKQDDDVYHGDIFPYLADEEKVEIILDLGNAEDETMITGILEAMDGTEGLERVVINEGADEYY